MPSPHDPLSAAAELELLRSKKRLVEGQLTELLKREPSFAPHAAASFEVLEELGRGGFGVVQRVRDRRLDREAALKMPHEGVDDRGSGLRLEREARLLARMAHPAIPALYESGRTASGHPYLLMPVLEGRGLDALILEGGSHRRFLLQVLLRVAEALAYAHSQKVLHRDLKPANIVVGDFGEVFVIDWGLGRVKEEDTTVSNEPATLRGLTQEDEVLGTPGYQSPEQAKGEPLDEATDVFALGALLTEILTGRLPVKGATSLNRSMATIRGEIRTPGQLRRGVPKALEELAAWSLAYEPRDRCPSARAFADALEEHLAEAPRRGLWPWAATAALVLALIAALALPEAAPRPAPAVPLAPRAAAPRPKPKPKRSAAEVLAEAWEALFAGEELRARGLIEDFGEGEALPPLERVGLGRTLMWLGELERAERCLTAASRLRRSKAASLLALHELEILRFPALPLRRTRFSDGFIEAAKESDRGVDRSLAEALEALFSLDPSRAISGFLGSRKAGTSSVFLELWAQRLLELQTGRIFASRLPATRVGLYFRVAQEFQSMRSDKARELMEGAPRGAGAPRLKMLECYCWMVLNEQTKARALLRAIPRASKDPYYRLLEIQLAPPDQQEGMILEARREFPKEFLFLLQLVNEVRSEVPDKEVQVALIKELRDRLPLESRLWLHTANHAEAIGDLETASADAQKVLLFEPLNASAHLVLGKVALAQGRLIETIRLAQEAFELAKGREQSLCCGIRGTALARLGRFEEAVVDLTRAIRELTEIKVYRFNRGYAYFMLKRHSEALADFEAAEAAGYSQQSLPALIKRCKEALGKR